MRVLFFLLVGSLVASCGGLNGENRADYEMKTYKLESSPECAIDSAACATFEVEYPEFPQLDSMVQGSIERQINYWLGGGSEGEVKSMTVLGNDFITDFHQFVKDMPDYGLSWYFKAKVTVLISSDSLISLQIDSDSFTGGAHGSYSTNFVNVEPKTGTAYLLGALLRPGYQQDLNRLGEEDFWKQRYLDESDSLGSTGFSFSPGGFKLNENYGFRKEGIVFFFNSYEIASYAEGPTEILIPYEKLAGLMK